MSSVVWSSRYPRVSKSTPSVRMSWSEFYAWVENPNEAALNQTCIHEHQQLYMRATCNSELRLSQCEANSNELTQLRQKHNSTLVTPAGVTRSRSPRASMSADTSSQEGEKQQGNVPKRPYAAIPCRSSEADGRPTLDPTAQPQAHRASSAEPLDTSITLSDGWTKTKCGPCDRHRQKRRVRLCAHSDTRPRP